MNESVIENTKVVEEDAHNNNQSALSPGGEVWNGNAMQGGGAGQQKKDTFAKPSFMMKKKKF